MILTCRIFHLFSLNIQTHPPKAADGLENRTQGAIGTTHGSPCHQSGSTAGGLWDEFQRSSPLQGTPGSSRSRAAKESVRKNRQRWSGPGVPLGRGLGPSPRCGAGRTAPVGKRHLVGRPKGRRGGSLRGWIYGGKQQEGEGGPSSPRGGGVPSAGDKDEAETVLATRNNNSDIC